MKDSIKALVVDQQTAASMLGISVSTLRRWHREGRGPRIVRLSRLVRYRPADLQQFLQRFEDRSPGDPRSIPLPRTS